MLLKVLLVSLVCVVVVAGTACVLGIFIWTNKCKSSASSASASDLRDTTAAAVCLQHGAGFVRRAHWFVLGDDGVVAQPNFQRDLLSLAASERGGDKPSLHNYEADGTLQQQIDALVADLRSSPHALDDGALVVFSAGHYEMESALADDFVRGDAPLVPLLENIEAVLNISDHLRMALVLRPDAVCGGERVSPALALCNNRHLNYPTFRSARAHRDIFDELRIMYGAVAARFPHNVALLDANVLLCSRSLARVNVLSDSAFVDCETCSSAAAFDVAQALVQCIK